MSGPFTVESLSPHRVLVDGPEDAADGRRRPYRVDAGAFVTSILDNLRRAGVQNTKRAERLEFSRLDPYPGVCVQGVGEYGENGATKTVAIAIGPEFGTVGPELIRDAAKEAVKFADLLVVCGFAFDPLAGEEASTPRPPDDPPGAHEPRPRDGRRAAQEDRHRATCSWSSASPTSTSARPGSGQLEVEIRGLDVYDPTTGALRSSSVDDIAAWFLDTDYDGDALLRPPRLLHRRRRPLRQAPPRPPRRHQRRGLGDRQLDVSRPFPRPTTGKSP